MTEAKWGPKRAAFEAELKEHNERGNVLRCPFGCVSPLYAGTKESEQECCEHWIAHAREEREECDRQDALPLVTVPLSVMRAHGLALDSQGRKDQPMARGLLDYFPDALAEMSELSRMANEKHNPGEEMHWSRDKSADHADTIVRHLCERGRMIEGEYPKPVRHSVALAWRAVALAQVEIEQARGDGKISRGSK